MRRPIVMSLLLLGCLSCTRPAPDPPGVGEQPEQYPERNPATRPSEPGPANALPPSESPEDPDTRGTTRTPPAAPAAPMDDVDDAGLAPRAADASR